MHLFSQIQNLQLLIFCMDGLEFLVNLDYVFFCNIIKGKHFYIVLLYLLSSFLYTRSLLVLYAYVFIESVDCILLLSFELKAILLISSVKTLYFHF